MDGLRFLSNAGIAGLDVWGFVEDKSSIWLSDVGQVFFIVSISCGILLALSFFGRVRRGAAELQETEAALHRRVRHEALVATLGQRALAHSDVDALLQDTVGLIAQAFEAECCMILERQSTGDALLLRAGVGWQPGAVGHTVLAGGMQSQASYTLSLNDSVIVEDLRTETRFTGCPLLSQHGIISGISVVIRGQDQPFGVLAVHSAQPHRFTADHLHCLRRVADVLTLALGRIHAEEQVRQAIHERAVHTAAEAVQERLSFMAGVSVALAASLEYDVTLEKLPRLAIPFLADWCAVALLHPDGGARPLPVAHIESTSANKVAHLQAICDALPHSHCWQQVARTERSQLLAVATETQSSAPAQDATQQALAQALGDCSIIMVPLRVRAQMLGVMTLITAESGRRYSAADMVMAEDLALRCAVALDNARCYEAARRASRDQEEARALLDALLTTAPVGMAFFDTELRYVRVNKALAAINGLPIEAHLGRTPYELLPNLAPLLEPVHRRVLEAAEPIVNVEVSGQTPAAPHEQRHWLVNYYPVQLPEKPFLGIGAVVVDITERRQMEERMQASLKEKEILLREIHHRVKNNLQIVSSLLDLQADTLEDPCVRLIFEGSQHRIQAMALIHECLYQSDDLARIDAARYFSRLCASLAQAYSQVSKQVTLEVQAEAIWLDVQMAIACGLILQELLSNGFKHAFPDGQRGNIWITLAVAPGNQALLSVRDTGRGFPLDVDFQNTDSLGLQLVCLLTEQLRGSITLERQGGTHWQVTFPLSGV
jgi:PAS domain S-box-containing protein